MAAPLHLCTLGACVHLFQQMFLRQTCLLAEGYFWGRFCYLERQKVATLCFLSLIFLRRTWYLAEGTFAAAVNNEVWEAGFRGPLQ